MTDKKLYTVQNSYKRMGKWKPQSEGEVVQIKFPKPTKTKSHFEKWGGWKHGSYEGRVQHMKKLHDEKKLIKSKQLWETQNGFAGLAPKFHVRRIIGNKIVRCEGESWQIIFKAG